MSREKIIVFCFELILFREDCTTLAVVVEFKMTDSADVRSCGESKNSQFMCFHCKKKVVGVVSCIHCKEKFHPACLSQAATQKTAVCKHSAEDKEKVEKTVNLLSVDLLLRIIQELEEKNSLLQENNALLREKLHYVQENPAKKGIPPKRQDTKNSINNSKQSEMATLEQTKPLELPNLSLNLNGRSKDPVLSQNEVRKAANDRSHNSKQVQEPVKIVNPASSEATKDKDIEEGEWRTQRSRKSACRRSNINTRPAPIKGTKENSSGLNVAKQYRWLFVSGFSTDTTTVDITNYVKENGINGTVCEKIKTRKDHVYSSFRLGVANEEEELVLSAMFWPKGVIVNAFLNLPRAASQFRG